MRHILLSLLLLICSAITTHSQQTARSFTRETRYLLYMPEGYDSDTSKQWPLMLFLHGSGESGTDVQKVKVNGPPMLVEKGKKYPFILVSPQADGRIGWDPIELYDLLTDLKKRYRVDKDRVYVTGLSMGGYGAWKLASQFPQEFAAVIPICGGGDTSTAWRLRNVPVWAFHGGKDDVVLPQQSEQMVAAVRKTNPTARLTIYPEVKHDSWTAAYNTDSLYEWMLSKKRFAYKEKPVAPEVLSTLAGTYVNKNDTLYITPDAGRLLVKTNRNNSVTLRPVSEKLFFIEEELPVDVEFTQAGKRRGLIVNGDTRDIFTKLP
ncbi:prolyl oligopeptidase family serine peptidase [Terrimonas sp. NA20]|uniref:Prolyl oligopeptidase family serine peptidase n=1 Tax=Terrimonas ginsenosidimutans TaxID=2908004 RepID=A0ABS9KW92_9BACT|nr:prolyl oligopeptidase family serine peptidase [Terrimonas ginsenosidimutans]MCG2616578.1 prolyl oligopeptidase family serine peptidase [Terrimonas ginsenosidimutans]